MPFNQNINWAAGGAAVVTLFAYFFPNLPEHVRDAILTLALIGLILVVPFLHTFINHPANVTKAEDLARKAVVAARRSGPGAAIVLALCVCMIGLSACAGPDPFFSNPQNDLNLAKAGISTIEALYMSACQAGAMQRICSDEDQAKAAQLEKGITDAISAAQLLVNIYNGVATPSGAAPAPSLADVEKAIGAVAKAVQDLTDFVNQLETKKARMLMGAKPQFSGSGIVTPPAH